MDFMPYTPSYNKVASKEPALTTRYARDILRVVRGEMVPLHAEGARPQLAREVHLESTKMSNTEDARNAANSKTDNWFFKGKARRRSKPNGDK